MEMNLICTIKKRGVDTVAFLLTAPNTDHASHVKNVPGVGKPYFVFASLPNGNPTSVDFADAPIVNIDESVNQANIDAMLANPPWDALVY